MLVEKKLNDALMDYTKGRKVVVLQCAQDGRIDANLLSDFLEDDQIKYLVDVPAYSNPDFEDAMHRYICCEECDEKEACGNKCDGDSKDCGNALYKSDNN